MGASMRVLAGVEVLQKRPHLAVGHFMPGLYGASAGKNLQNLLYVRGVRADAPLGEEITQDVVNGLWALQPVSS